MLFSVSVAYNSFILALISRFIFGVGSENICVAESTMITKWFINKEISFAMSMDTCISRLVNALSLITQPLLKKHFGSLMPGLYVSVGLVLIALCISFVLTGIDRNTEEQDKRHGYIAIIAESDKVMLKDILLFKFDFWALAIITGFYYILISTLIVYLKLYLERKFQVSSISFYYSIPYLMAAVFTPILGALTDRIGRRSIMLIISGVLFNIGHFTLFILPAVHSYWFIFSLLIIGLAYSLMVGCTWSSIP
jgi:MFS family permease